MYYNCARLFMLCTRCGVVNEVMFGFGKHHDELIFGWYPTKNKCAIFEMEIFLRKRAIFNYREMWLSTPACLYVIRKRQIELLDSDEKNNQGNQRVDFCVPERTVTTSSRYSIDLIDLIRRDQ